MKPVTAPQRRALERIAAYGLLTEAGTYHLGNGETVHAGVVRRLLERGLLAPAGDGLLEGFTQTFEIVEGAADGAA